MTACQGDICTEKLNGTVYGLKHCPIPILLKLYPPSPVLFCLIPVRTVLTTPQQVWGGDARQAVSGRQDRKEHPDWGWCIQM